MAQPAQEEALPPFPPTAALLLVVALVLLMKMPLPSKSKTKVHPSYLLPKKRRLQLKTMLLHKAKMLLLFHLEAATAAMKLRQKSHLLVQLVQQTPAMSAQPVLSLVLEDLVLPLAGGTAMTTRRKDRTLLKNPLRLHPSKVKDQNTKAQMQTMKLQLKMPIYSPTTNRMRFKTSLRLLSVVRSHARIT